MTSADFLAHRNQIYSKTSPGKSIFLQSIPDTSTTKRFFVLFGRYVAVDAYPHFVASYVLPVRRYQLLQARFLHCLDYSKPACDLLTLRIINPRTRDLHPLENKHACFSQQ